MCKGDCKNLSNGKAICCRVKEEKEKVVETWPDNPLEVGHYDYNPSSPVKQHEPLS